MDHASIAYQNKDITNKVLAEKFKGKTFQVYGLNVPKIERVLPTNIPTIRANELRLDNLFELEDGTAALVDYESDYREEDKVKYLNYLTGIANRYLQEKKSCPILRMIVIYTADIKRKQVQPQYHIGALTMQVECAFLSELNSEEIFLRLKEKIERNDQLEDEELMELMILPLSYQKKEEKQSKIHQMIQLAIQIGNRAQQLFVLAGILVFTDKIIDQEAANKIRRAIEMTQVAQIFEEEKQQALTQVAQIFEEEKQQVVKKYEEEKQQVVKKYEEEKQQTVKKYEEEKQQAVLNTSEKIVQRMIRKNFSTEEIVSLVSNFSQDDVEALRVKMAEEEQSLRISV